jgi:hypothetical protein
MNSENMTIQQITEFTSLVKDIVVTIAAIVAAVVGFLGLRTWRRELKGRSEYTKAKEILRAVYRVRYAFWDVRNPAIWQYEYPKEMCEPSGHLKKECRYEGTLHVYEKRWKFLEEAFNQLREQHLDAEVEWGEDFQDVIWPLLKCQSELLVAIQEYIKLTSSDSYIRSETDWSAIVHRTKNDNFTQQINTAIQEFEKRLRPLIKK